MDGHDLKRVAGLGVGLRKQRIYLLVEPIEVGEVGAFGQVTQQIKISGRVFESGFIFHAGRAAQPEPHAFHPIPQWTAPALRDRFFEHRQDGTNSAAPCRQH